MNAKKTDPTLVEKSKVVKKDQVKAKKSFPVKFDKEGLLLTWGIGIVVTGIGILIIWATKTAPSGPSHSTARSVSQKLVRLLPESTKEILAFIIGGLFVLFGVFCLIMGLKIIFEYFRDKLKN